MILENFKFVYFLHICISDILIFFIFNFFLGRDHAKKFKPGEMEIQITGKNCIVTGANSGIGYATAEGLARRF